MKPLVIYSKKSEAYLGDLFAQSDLLNFFEVRDDRTKLPEARLVFFRIGESLQTEIVGDAWELERYVKSKGARRVINSVYHKWTHGRRDVAFARLRSAGFRVPWFWPMPGNYQVKNAVKMGKLKYPFIIRTAEGLNAVLTYMIQGEDDLKDVLASHAKMAARNMVVEYIPTQKMNGCHQKWRPYIFGGKVDMWECGIARNWRVNLANNMDFDDAKFRDSNDPSRWPVLWDRAVIEAAKVLDMEVCAFDVIADAHGNGPIFLDLNDTYGMTASKLEEAGRKLFHDDVREIRAGHYRRFAEWLVKEEANL